MHMDKIPLMNEVFNHRDIFFTFNSRRAVDAFTIGTRASNKSMSFMSSICFLQVWHMHHHAADLYAVPARRRSRRKYDAATPNI